MPPIDCVYIPTELTVLGVGAVEVMVIDDGALSLTLPPLTGTGNHWPRLALTPALTLHLTGRASSYLYRSMTGFLDNSLSGCSDSELLGPVLSSLIHPTDQTPSLTSSVEITFPYDSANNSIPTCVFWDFDE